MVAEKEIKKEKLIGRLVVKLAGRDAGQIGVIIEELTDEYVLIDGSVRRRKCNLKHIEILESKADVKTGVTHSDVVSALAKLGVKVVTRKEKPKKVAVTESATRAERKEAKVAEKKAKKAAKEKEKKAETVVKKAEKGETVAKKATKKKPAKKISKAPAKKK